MPAGGGAGLCRHSMAGQKGSTKAVWAYQPTAKQPSIMDRSLEEISGERHARRPSQLARKQGKRRITEVEGSFEHEQPDDWAEADVMPVEDISLPSKDLAAGVKGKSEGGAAMRQ